MDKAFWKQVAAEGYKIPDEYHLTDMTDALLSFLGSVDPELRDTIAYQTLVQWILKRTCYTPVDLRRMRDRLLLNLMAGLGENGTDTVFLRSFSVLVLGLIVYRDNLQPFMTEGEIGEILDSVLTYFSAENDLRGWIPRKGWAHSIAHSADTMKFLVRNRCTEGVAHLSVLVLISGKLMSPTTTIMNYDEDERLAQTFMEILKRNEIEETILTYWANQLADWKGERNPLGDFDPTVFATYQNIKHFLRSLYFHLTRLEAPSLEVIAFTESITEAVKVYNY